MFQEVLLFQVVAIISQGSVATNLRCGDVLIVLLQIFSWF